LCSCTTRRRVYLNPDTGRFNRPDPWSGNNFDPQSLHKYAYAHCDPVSGIDPSGKFLSIIEFSLTSAIDAGTRAWWEGARAPTYQAAITGALILALLIGLVDVVPRAIERIEERRKDQRIPYVRYDFRPAMTSFGPGTWVLGPEGAALDWGRAISVTDQCEITTLYMYTIMARRSDVIPKGLVNGLPQYRLTSAVSGENVVLTRVLRKPDDSYPGPF